MADQETTGTNSGMVIFIVPAACMNVHALSSHAIPEDAGDAEVAEKVREAMREAKLPEETIGAFSRSDLLKMHRVGGYTASIFIRNAQRSGLEKCGLTPALVDHMVSALEKQRGEYDSRNICFAKTLGHVASCC